MNDSIADSNLQTLGTMRANEIQREQDISKPGDPQAHSLDPTQQTDMATLQRINQALLLQLRQQQEANQMHRRKPSADGRAETAAGCNEGWISGCGRLQQQLPDATSRRVNHWRGAELLPINLDTESEADHGNTQWITQGCDSLTATAAPSVDALGLRICIALATIMLVWFGVQEALASAQGGPGFNMAKFMNFLHAHYFRLRLGEVSTTAPSPALAIPSEVSSTAVRNISC